MTNKSNLEYAEHNWKTCKFLDKKPEFSDWVITTAFYSALHYVRYKIFPFKVIVSGKDVEIKDFEKCFRVYNPSNLNKHKLLSQLVEERLSEIAVDYNRLKDMSWTARYHNYKFSREISNDAKKRLQSIKAFCSKLDHILHEKVKMK
jgi:hypothetical protein